MTGCMTFSTKNQGRGIFFYLGAEAAFLKIIVIRFFYQKTGGGIEGGSKLYCKLRYPMRLEFQKKGSTSINALIAPPPYDQKK